MILTSTLSLRYGRNLRIRLPTECPRYNRTHETQNIRHLRQYSTPADQTQDPFLLMYLSEILRPFRMNDTILATPPMASPAFSPLYSQAGYDSDEATNANQFLSTLHSRLMGILAQRVRKALKTDALHTRVKETDNKLHYSIRDSLLLAQNTNG